MCAKGLTKLGMGRWLEEGNSDVGCRSAFRYCCVISAGCAAGLKNDANFETMFPPKKQAILKNLFTIIALLLYVQYCKAISYLATRV